MQFGRALRRFGLNDRDFKTPAPSDYDVIVL